MVADQCLSGGPQTPPGRAKIGLCGALWRLARGLVPASCYAPALRWKA